MRYPTLKIAPLLVSVILLTSCAAIKPTGRQAVQHPPEKLRADVDFAWSRLQKLHPRLYKYTGEEYLHNKFDSLRSAITSPMTSREFFFKLSPVISAIRQGHTRLLLPDRRMRIHDQFSAGTMGKSPLDRLDFEIFDGKLFIVRDVSGNNIPPGTQVLTINKTDPLELIDRYRSTFSSDGFNQTYIDRSLGIEVPDYFFNDNGLTDSVICELKYNDTVRSVCLKRPTRKLSRQIAKTREQIATERIDRKKESEKRRVQGYDELTRKYSKELTFMAPDSSIALMKIHDFSNGVYREFYQNSFRLLDTLKTETLILDLRDNLGGELEDAKTLFSYLADTSFVFIEKPTVTSKYSILQERYFQGNSLVINMILGLLYPAVLVERWLTLLFVTREPGNKYTMTLPQNMRCEPKRARFKGKLYVLINGGSFSASAILASNLKARKGVVFAGEETGGASEGTVAGKMALFTLPESRLRILFGLLYIQPRNKPGMAGRGVFPDIEIKPTLEDRVKGVDRGIEEVTSDK